MTSLHFTSIQFNSHHIREEPQRCLCGEECCTGFIGVSEDFNTSGGHGAASTAKKSRTGHKDATDLEAELLSLGALEDPADAESLVRLLRQPEGLKDLAGLIAVLEGTSETLPLRKFMSLQGLRVLAQIASARLERQQQQTTTAADDEAVVDACLKALAVLPIGSVNSVEESGWMDLLERLQDSAASEQARRLQEKFSSLQRIFKIPKKRRDPDETDGAAAAVVTEGTTDTEHDAATATATATGQTIMAAVPKEFSQALQQRKRPAVDEERNERLDERSNNNNNNNSYSRSSNNNNSSGRDYQQSRPSQGSRNGRDGTDDHRRRPHDYSRQRRRGPGDYHDRRVSGASHRYSNSSYRDGSSYSGYSNHESRSNHSDYRTHSTHSNHGTHSNHNHNTHNSHNTHNTHNNHNNHNSKANLIPDPNWLEAQTEDGQKYYYHRETRETSWTRPMVPVSDRNDALPSVSPDRGAIPASSTTATATASLLEGVQDAQLAAIIDRAKARRSQVQQQQQQQQSTLDSTTNQLDIFSLIASSSSSATTTKSNAVPSGSSTVSKQAVAKLKDQVSEVVVRFLSHYKSHLGDDFKDSARRYTHRIVEKELSSSSSSDGVAAFEMTARKRAKIKTYLAEAMRGRKIPLLPEHEILLK